jgi:hypothetical protein
MYSHPMGEAYAELEELLPGSVPENVSKYLLFSELNHEEFIVIPKTVHVQWSPLSIIKIDASVHAYVAAVKKSLSYTLQPIVLLTDESSGEVLRVRADRINL